MHGQQNIEEKKVVVFWGCMTDGFEGLVNTTRCPV